MVQIPIIHITISTLIESNESKCPAAIPTATRQSATTAAATTTGKTVFIQRRRKPLPIVCGKFHLICFALQMHQIQSSASSVNQTGTTPNMTTAGNMRNAAVAGNSNGAIHNQGGMQQAMNSSGMPFNTGKLTSMMNTGKSPNIFEKVAIAY